MSKNHFETIAVIGLGLIGSSLIQAAQENSLVGKVMAYDNDPEVRATAKKLHLGTVVEKASEAVEEADLVVLAIPVGAMAESASEIATHLKSGAILTDTGSTKKSVINDVRPHLKNDTIFIPSHPIAGTEFSGPESGFSTLFQDRYWIVLPCDAPKKHVAHLRKFYEKMGAEVDEMDVDYHDRVLAITSHLPHLIAYTIVGTAFDVGQQFQNDVFKYSASGFRDFTRIASSDPVMWRDVFLNNEAAILEMLGRFNEDLSYLQRAIRWKEGEKLQDIFTRTRDIRAKIKDYGQLD